MTRLKLDSLIVATCSLAIVWACAAGAVYGDGPQTVEVATTDHTHADLHSHPNARCYVGVLTKTGRANVDPWTPTPAAQGGR